MATASTQTPDQVSNIPIPTANTGVDFLDGVLNTAIGAVVYKDFRDAALRQDETLNAVPQRQQVGAQPVSFQPSQSADDNPKPEPIPVAYVYLAAGAFGLAVLYGLFHR